MMTEELEIIPLPVAAMEHGEGPIWDDKRRLVYWVDLLKGILHQYDPTSKEDITQNCGEALGVVSIREQEGLIYGLRSGFAKSKSIQDHLEVVQLLEENGSNVRFNDGATAPCGRFYAGTMQDDGAKSIGKLYCVDTDLTVTVMDENLYVPNGMGWSLDERTFFMIDTGQHCIFSYRYNRNTGELSDKKIFKQFEEDVHPDGMCIDANGNFWIAMWEGSRIEVLDHRGDFLRKIDLPVTHPTSCCFGGSTLEDLYITTSQLMLTPEQKAEQPLAGKTLFIYNAGQGKIEPRFNG